MVPAIPRGNYVSAFVLAWWGITVLAAGAFGRGNSNSNATVENATVEYDRDIRPILSNHCLQCHGPDSAARKGNLRLDQASGLHSVLTPGQPEASELIRRVKSSDVNEQMPPLKHDRLSTDEIDRLSEWVRSGAEWSPHWAFVAPKLHEIPDVDDGGWSIGAIDRFVFDRLQREGLTPRPMAARTKQLRRVTLDLTGLPPSPEDLNRFLGNSSPDAYEREVDRLFLSPRYAERRTADWLDAARYADSNGFQNDFSRAMWPWRDWVLRAFQNNMPFDQFIIEQMAGDLLPNPTLEQEVATGFHRNHRSITEGGSIEEEWRIENVMDRAETTATVFLGLTMGCARCHDHKFDPVSQDDFYGFFAFFNNSTDKGFHNEVRGNVPPMVEVPTEENRIRLAKFDADIASVEKEIAASSPQIEKEFRVWLRSQKHVYPDSLEGPLWHAALSDDFALRHAGGLSLAPLSKAGVTQGLGSIDEGLWASSVNFDGSDASGIEYGKSIEFERDSAFSFTAWVKAKGDGAIFSKMDFLNAYRGLDMLLFENRSLTVHLITQWPEKALKAQSKQSIPEDVWTHVALTYDGSSQASGLKLFISGEQVDFHVHSDTLDGTIRTDVPLVVGRRHLAPSLNGRLSDFRIYDRVLPPDELHRIVDESIAMAISELRDPLKCADLRSYFEERESSSKGSPKRRLAELMRERDEYRSTSIPTSMILQERHEPRETYVLDRGLYDKPMMDRPVAPGIPSFLPGLGADLPRNRLGLAQWLVDSENPLTARVTVNRLWQEFFGAGLVPSSENFGIRGDRPEYPRLLDWLATQLVSSGWDLRAVQKSVVMSATYRQRSEVTPQSWQHDPENRLYSRGPRFRMSAEMIRDSALSMSGLLVERLFGPPVKPYQPDGLWSELAGGASQGPYRRDQGDGLYRRSLYIYRKRTVPHPTMNTFDAPSWELCQVARTRTNTPLQALALLNDITYVEAARHFAQRLIDESSESEERIRSGFRIATSRYPTKEELAVLIAGLRNYTETYARDVAMAKEFVSHGDSPPEVFEDESKLVELAAYTALASVILNLDETVTKD